MHNLGSYIIICYFFYSSYIKLKRKIIIIPANFIACFTERLHHAYSIPVGNFSMLNTTVSPNSAASEGDIVLLYIHIVCII